VGLRTLIVASKQLSSEEFEIWSSKMDIIGAERNNEKLDALYD
jgi:hypothetical protein